MNYAELKTEVADYLHRTDLTVKIPLFITLAETAMFRDVDPKALEVSTTGIAINSYDYMPSDFDSLTKLSITYGGREITLDYKAGTESHVSVIPTGYTYEANQIRLWGGSAKQAYTLNYKAKLSPLGSVVTTNWLLTNAPDLYMYSACLEGAKYLKDQAEISVLGPLVSSMMASINSSIERRGLPSSGSLRIKPRR